MFSPHKSIKRSNPFSTYMPNPQLFRIFWDYYPILLTNHY